MANLDDVSPEQLPGEESTEAELASAHESIESTEPAETADIARGEGGPSEDAARGD